MSGGGGVRGAGDMLVRVLHSVFGTLCVYLQHIQGGKYEKMHLNLEIQIRYHHYVLCSPSSTGFSEKGYPVVQILG